MTTVRVRLTPNQVDYAPTVPIVIPDLDEVRKFAKEIHAKGEAWKGEISGWSAEYNPERTKPPLDSKMKFTPADFCIGESDIWFFSMMWERGHDKEPVEFLDDSNVLAPVLSQFPIFESLQPSQIYAQ